MAYVKKDKCKYIELNYKISAFKYIIVMEKDKYQIYGVSKQRNLSNRVIYTSVVHKLYNNVVISNKPPTYKDLNSPDNYSYTRIFI